MSLDKSELPRTEEEWRVRLSPQEFRVLREAGTEPPWTGEYVDTKTPGVYHCRACGLELFSSDTKFDSHCGWPSFDDAIPGRVKEIEDRSLGMSRTEIRCARCDSHLGHVFHGEGFTPKDTRHCVNSLSIRLEPRTDA
ncbi:MULTISPECIES: peptide-methionine (R)-S-oxide reductase MsrB [unclassified Micromonospora]|uniref:peptide-methionine (R)-S-oxide reductase MsrB n=1 Tax=unclassified Micromonospora TaxID=2617518 RepID=UPI002FEECF4B